MNSLNNKVAIITGSSRGIGKAVAAKLAEEQIKKFGDIAALRRIGEVEDIADIVAFLASENSRWITVQNIHANGGLA